MRFNTKTILLILSFLFLSSFVIAQTTRWRLVWDKNTETDISHYEIYRSIGLSGATQLHPIYATVSHHDTSHFDENNKMELIDDYQLQKGIRIYYRLKAVNNSGLKSDFSEEVDAAIPYIGGYGSKNFPDTLFISVGSPFDPLELDEYIFDPDNQNNEITWDINILGDNIWGMETTVNSMTHVASFERTVLDLPGSMKLLFTANDATGFFDIDSVVFTVTSLRALDDAYLFYINEDSELKVLDNDLYAETNEPKIISIFPPDFDRAKISTDSTSILYTSPEETNILESFWYTIKNVSKEDYAEVRIEIIKLFAQNDNFNITMNEERILEVTNNDTYIPNTISINTFTVPLHGSVEVLADTLIKYTPDEDYFSPDEPDSFKYILNSTRTSADTATVYISIDTTVHTNLPPAVDIPDFIRNFGQEFSILNLDLYVTDPDNSDNEINWLPAAGHVELDVTINNTNRTAAIYKPNASWTGSESIVFTARDPDGLTDSDTATFTILSYSESQAGLKITAGPIPLRSSQGAKDITFRNLPIGGELIIFDLLGYPVFKTDITTSEYPWITVNQHGKWVRSGVYLYVVKNDKGKIVKSDKVIIIR
ncbi:MAG: hypothetical protein JW956_01800 [Calditrichaceae bacterium]|nr:hypothetical protein [Calditrichaceae bacterium]